MNDAVLPFRVVRSPKLFELLRIIREADVIHVAGVSLVPILSGWLLRKTIVIEHHFYDALCPNGLLFYEPLHEPCPGHFLARRYDECIRCNSGKSGLWKSILALALTFPRRWLSQRVAANIAITAHVQNRLRLPRTEVVYYGVPNVSVGQPAIENDSSPTRFAYVGRLVSIKGLDLIIEAARKLHEQKVSFHLDIIGDGPERSRMESMTAAYGLNDKIAFLGFLQREDLQTVIDHVDVVLMPSIWEETAGLSAMEHMMRGKPTIVADIGGLTEVVADAGLKFPYGDADALVACMRKLVEDPKLAHRLGEIGFGRASTLFNTERTTSAHRALYDRVRPPEKSKRRSCPEGKV